MISTEKRLCGFLLFVTSGKVHEQLVLRPRRRSRASWLCFVSPEMCVRFQSCRNEIRGVLHSEQAHWHCLKLVVLHNCTRVIKGCRSICRGEGKKSLLVQRTCH